MTYFKDLLRRRVPQVVAIYLGACWGLLEFTDFITQRFALSLRRRGHRAFVSDAEVPERGHFWRVRIGPFDDRREAASYRSSFEQDENMNTIVIRRRD